MGDTHESTNGGGSRATAVPTVRPSKRARGRRRTAALSAEHLSRAERVARGRAARAEAPRSSHGFWEPPPDRSDPVELLAVQAKTRVPELVPIRHGRMLVSPFSYYRGAALAMASDLAATRDSGLKVQACGDAHLSNFGIFGSPERHLFFDVNDFDETASGPWEWDIKRLAASLEVAGRENGFTRKQRAGIVRRAVRSYRETMREFAGMPMLGVWYAHLDMDEMLPRFRSLLNPEKTPSVWRAIAKARAHDSHQAFDKLCHVQEGEPRIISDPPLIVPIEAFVEGVDPSVQSTAMQAIIHSYRDTLESNQRHLLEGYRFVHLARKVVGVGSVGTEAWIMLLLDDHDSPLLLQVKQAETSVLEQFTSKSEFSNHGERVVAGQRLMQAASDIFLGWERLDWEGDTRDYYIRQLRDWKGSADIRGMTPAGMRLWGLMCGWTLARGHARSGDRIAIAAYLGRSDVFDRAIVDFSVAYADQTERDYQALRDAVASGTLAAETDI
jgi:uncharacterized protein (DUF2252 family)